MSELHHPDLPFAPPARADSESIADWIGELRDFPGRLHRFLRLIPDEHYDTPWRPGKWTIRQLVQHIADSHANGVIRFQWALTEEVPTIKAYDQDAFARLPSSTSVPLIAAVEQLHALHDRWTALLTGIPQEAYDRELVHPESGTLSLRTLLSLYAWHGAHHMGQIEVAAREGGWSEVADEEPAPARDARVELREVTEENLGAVLRLEVAPSQRTLVATNAVSLAQAGFSDEAWYRAIYAGETPVGFVMLAIDEAKPEYFVWRFMIDQRYQGRGFGRRAIELVCDHVRGLPGATELLLSHVGELGNPGGFYRSLGFEHTGAVEDGERVMRMELRQRR